MTCRTLPLKPSTKIPRGVLPAPRWSSLRIFHDAIHLSPSTDAVRQLGSRALEQVRGSNGFRAARRMHR